VTQAFLQLASQPEPAQIIQYLPLLERFVVLLYNRKSNKTTANAARKQLFSKKGSTADSTERYRVGEQGRNDSTTAKVLRRHTNN